MALTVAVNAGAQDVATRSIEELNLSYVYAPIFGTGIYHAGAEQTTVLKIPANGYLLNQSEDAEIFWLLPVTFGVRRAAIEGVIDDVLEGELHDMTFMPGVARRFEPAARWQLSASAQLGVAHDFTLNTSRTLYTSALRATHWWLQGERRWTWGSRVRLAGQNKLVEGKRQGFGLLETGIEWDTPTDYQLFGEPLHVSIYGIAQYFIQHTGIKGVEGEPIGSRNLYNLGFSLGWAEPVEVLGVPVDRVGMTFIGGDDVRALSFNLGFPLASD
ncbi:hypothetical protein M5M_13505 [Simiduia agarivorans SA1 = DSM 21679]|uniref:Uncharacterized protein n=1 Tax=Simiduia agarivorans (strain DSM 21679 / JCM 13881 / BCRC 17597 / SA1) TaxID=1117647 RepID=K4KNN3_SIMAS|nr:hypothetical protein M5M_13505 [Simiduia agarivorans SA1 = DSM 21679]